MSAGISLEQCAGYIRSDSIDAAMCGVVGRRLKSEISIARHGHDYEKVFRCNIELSRLVLEKGYRIEFSGTERRDMKSSLGFLLTTFEHTKTKFKHSSDLNPFLLGHYHISKADIIKEMSSVKEKDRTLSFNEKSQVVTDLYLKARERYITRACSRKLADFLEETSTFIPSIPGVEIHTRSDVEKFIEDLRNESLNRPHSSSDPENSNSKEFVFGRSAYINEMSNRRVYVLGSEQESAGEPALLDSEVEGEEGAQGLDAGDLTVPGGYELRNSFPYEMEDGEEVTFNLRPISGYNFDCSLRCLGLSRPDAVSLLKNHNTAEIRGLVLPEIIDILTNSSGVGPHFMQHAVWGGRGVAWCTLRDQGQMISQRIREMEASGDLAEAESLEQSRSEVDAERNKIESEIIGIARTEAGFISFVDGFVNGHTVPHDAGSPQNMLHCYQDRTFTLCALAEIRDIPIEIYREVGGQLTSFYRYIPSSMQDEAVPPLNVIRILHNGINHFDRLDITAVGAVPFAPQRDNEEDLVSEGEGLTDKELSDTETKSESEVLINVRSSRKRRRVIVDSDEESGEEGLAPISIPAAAAASADVNPERELMISPVPLAYLSRPLEENLYSNDSISSDIEARIIGLYEKGVRPREIFRDLSDDQISITRKQVELAIRRYRVRIASSAKGLSEKVKAKILKRHQEKGKSPRNITKRLREKGYSVDLKEVEWVIQSETRSNRKRRRTNSEVELTDEIKKSITYYYTEKHIGPTKIHRVLSRDFKGLSVNQISKYLQVERALGNIGRLIKRSVPPLTEDLKKRIESLVQEGKGSTEVCNELTQKGFNVTKGQVGKFITSIRSS